MAGEYTLFGRTVEVTVVMPSGRTTTFTSLPLRLSDRPKPNISAKASYKVDGKPPKCTLKLLNPPQELVGEALAAGSGAVVQVRAGYDGKLDEVFTGKAIREGVSFSAPGGKDAELAFECVAGAKLYREAIASISVTGRVTAKQLIQQACNQAGYLVKGLDEVPDVVFPSGYYATSNVSVLLDKLAAITKTTISYTSDTTVKITGRQVPPSGTERVPFFDQEQAGVIGTPTKTDKGLKFKVLLRAEIRPGSYVSIRYYDFVAGTYVISTVRVSDVTFNLSTYGKNFYTSIVGKEVERAV